MQTSIKIVKKYSYLVKRNENVPTGEGLSYVEKALLGNFGNEYRSYLTSLEGDTIGIGSVPYGEGVDETIIGTYFLLYTENGNRGLYKITDINPAEDTFKLDRDVDIPVPENNVSSIKTIFLSTLPDHNAIKLVVPENIHNTIITHNPHYKENIDKVFSLMLPSGSTHKWE